MLNLPKPTNGIQQQQEEPPPCGTCCVLCDRIGPTLQNGAAQLEHGVQVVPQCTFKGWQLVRPLVRAVDGAFSLPCWLHEQSHKHHSFLAGAVLFISTFRSSLHMPWR